MAVTEEIMDENELKKQIEEKKEHLEELAKKLEERLKSKNSEVKAVLPADEEEVALYDINNTYIDFRHLILGQKLQLVYEGSKEDYVFDDFTLSNIISQMIGNASLF